LRSRRTIRNSCCGWGVGVAAGNLDLGVTLVQLALELQPSLGPFLDRLPEQMMPAASAVRERLDRPGT
jgi:hypothetical protein